MRSAYLATVLVPAWMAFATCWPLHRVDPYPFPFMLPPGNVVRLLLTLVILVGQQVLGESS